MALRGPVRESSVLLRNIVNPPAEAAQQKNGSGGIFREHRCRAKVEYLGNQQGSREALIACTKALS